MRKDWINLSKEIKSILKRVHLYVFFLLRFFSLNLRKYVSDYKFSGSQLYK